MFVSNLKVRIRALLLFFIDYKVILYCFTILSLSIGYSIFLERSLFENEAISFKLLSQIFLPYGIFISLFFVSYKLLCGVYFFRTALQILAVGCLLVTPFFVAKYVGISTLSQKVVSFTNKNIHISGVITSQEKVGTYLLHSGSKGLGNSLIRFKSIPVLHSGQRCNLKVHVVEPTSFKEFDYKKYLFRKGIYSILEVEEYECVNGGNIFLELRYILERVVERSISEPEASLLIGIMFGSKRVFLPEFNSALNSSGVSHIIAASGYNVALVSQSVENIGKKLSGRYISILKILCIWGFSIFSGLSSSLVRASSMVTVSLFAYIFGREGNKSASLILCITILILLNPFLIHDVGFLFSFVSVTGLMFLPKCFEYIKSKFFKESILTTLTCILFTLPISVIFFGKVSSVSLVSNVLVIPVINSTIFWGIWVTLINWVLDLKILYLIPYIQLNIFKNLVLMSSNIKMVDINVNGYILSICMYLVLFIFCLLKYPVSSKNHYIYLSKKYV